MKTENIKPGEACHLVFKVQAFAPSANADTRTMDMVLNVISGTYRGTSDDGFCLFETETPSGAGILWYVNLDDVLMFGIRRDVPRLARV